MTAAHTRGQSLRPGVFFCYRRQDSAEAALRVYRLLNETLGARLGGVIGLAGSLLVFGAGWRLAGSRPVGVSAAEPLPST